jgi:hypothetical protein
LKQDKRAPFLSLTAHTYSSVKAIVEFRRLSKRKQRVKMPLGTLVVKQKEEPWEKEEFKARWHIQRSPAQCVCFN